jgi:hypothetical protein
MVAAGPFAPGHLGELTQIVPFEMVDDVLTSTMCVHRRVRDLPSPVMEWYSRTTPMRWALILTR